MTREEQTALEMECGRSYSLLNELVAKHDRVRFQFVQLTMHPTPPGSRELWVTIPGREPLRFHCPHGWMDSTVYAQLLLVLE